MSILLLFAACKLGVLVFRFRTKDGKKSSFAAVLVVVVVVVVVVV